jgi:hypothetical protein
MDHNYHWDGVGKACCQSWWGKRPRLERYDSASSGIGQKESIVSKEPRNKRTSDYHVINHIEPDFLDMYNSGMRVQNGAVNCIPARPGACGHTDIQTH